MADFLIAYNKTGKIEGLWSNDKDDSGGETVFGIARNYWPNWSGWKIIDEQKSKHNFPKNISDVEDKIEPLVYQFYKTKFWDVIKGDFLLDQNIANELYDTGVNFGIKRAIEFAQEACNLLNNSGKLYAEIDVDGKFGDATLKTINSHPHKDTLFKVLNLLQGEAYINICRKNRTQEKYLRGWVNNRVITNV